MVRRWSQEAGAGERPSHQECGWGGGGHLRVFASNLEPHSSWKAGSGVGFLVGEDRIGQALRLKS